MGTDIHMLVERKVDGNWESADKWSKCEYTGKQVVAYGDQIFKDRNYALFSILAGVRNGYGFAGTDTGDEVTPISEPRGVPDDISPDGAEMWIGDHSHSWLTLAEIMAYDWTQTATRRGVVTASQYYLWKRDLEYHAAPRDYFGSRFGGSIKDLTNEEMDTVIKAAKEQAGGTRDVYEVLLRSDNFQTKVEWQEPYYLVASRFLGTVVPRLWRLGAPDDVRLVFGFDS